MFGKISPCFWGIYFLLMSERPACADSGVCTDNLPSCASKEKIYCKTKNFYDQCQYYCGCPGTTEAEYSTELDVTTQSTALTTSDTADSRSCTNTGQNCEQMFSNSPSVCSLASFKESCAKTCGTCPVGLSTELDVNARTTALTTENEFATVHTEVDSGSCTDKGQNCEALLNNDPSLCKDYFHKENCAKTCGTCREVSTPMVERSTTQEVPIQQNTETTPAFVDTTPTTDSTQTTDDETEAITTYKNMLQTAQASHSFPMNKDKNLQRTNMYTRATGYFDGLVLIENSHAPHEVQCTRNCLKRDQCAFFKFRKDKCLLYKSDALATKTIDCSGADVFCCSIGNSVLIT